MNNGHLTPEKSSREESDKTSIINQARRPIDDGVFGEGSQILTHQN